MVAAALLQGAPWPDSPADRPTEGPTDGLSDSPLEVNPSLSCIGCWLLLKATEPTDSRGGKKQETDGEVLALSHASSLFFCYGKQVNTIDFVSAVTSEAAASCSRYTFLFFSARPRSSVVSAHAACFPTLRQSAELSQLSTLCLWSGAPSDIF